MIPGLRRIGQALGATLVLATCAWTSACDGGSGLEGDGDEDDAVADLPTDADDADAPPDRPDVGADADLSDEAEADADADADDGEESSEPDITPPFDGFAEGDATDGEAPDSAGCTPLWGGECNANEQCGCGPGERCVVTPPDDAVTEICVAEGSEPAGTPCDGLVDDCVAGTECLPEWEFDAYEWACTPFCLDDIDCPAGWSCGCGLSLSGASPYSICCMRPDDCDVFTAEGCHETETCYWMGDATRCVSGGSRGPGEPCGSSECRPGSGCYGFGDAGDMLCYRYCRLGGGLPDCSDVPGTVCSGIGSPLFGVCREPD